MNVLLVESNPDVAECARNLLMESSGHLFHVARSPDPDAAGAGLLDGRHAPDVVLLAITGLDRPAEELVSRLALAAAPRPLVVLAATEDESSALRALDRGAQEFLPLTHANPGMLARGLLYAVERRRATEALAESQAQMRRLAENAPDIIYRIRLRPSFGFEFVSRAVTDIVGYTPEEHYADPDLANRILHPDDLPRLADMIAGRSPFRSPAILRFIHRDGHLVWTEHRYSPMRDATGTVIALEGVGRDISDRVHQEEALQHTEAQLILSQKLEAVGRLAGGVAHDFNNILTTIIGYSELLLERIPAEHPDRHFIGEIHKAGQRATLLTQQLLAFSRKQVQQPRVLDLNAELGDLREMLGRLIGEDIEVRMDLAPDLGRIKADAGQIEQVVMNLVVNSRDAMPEGGVLTLETSNAWLDQEYAARHLAVRPGAYVRLTVSDSGAGMDAATQAQIFEPFFTTKEKGKGTGLGLSTVYGIVKQSGGNIWVYSEPGKGTTFKIYLPRVTDGSEPVSVAPVPVTIAHGTETILLVEDETGVRELATDVLKSFGYRVLVAPDGAHALQVQADHAGPIHLLVTDVVMPQMSGRVLADRLRPLRPATRVLFMSGYTEDAIIQHRLLVSGIAFLEKPFTPTGLAAKVREVLDGPPQDRLPLVV